MRLDALIAGMSMHHVGGISPTGVVISALCEDSRAVTPGALFIARQGAKTDGKTFVRDALARGAGAILTDDPGLDAGGVPVFVAENVRAESARLAERYYGGPSRSLSVLGVTGTNGKTTTTSLVWQLLNGAGRRCGLIGTVTIDDGGGARRATMTTPPACETSRVLASMVRQGCVAASMEVSSHALDQRRCDALRFRVGVFTNLTGDHLDYHGTMEAYGAAKARLFEMLPPDGVGIVNSDDSWGERMIRASAAPVWTCTATGRPGATCAVEMVSTNARGTRLVLRGPWGRIDADVPLIGSYNAMNVLQATAGAHALGLEAGALAAGFARVTAPPGRLERVGGPDDDVAVYVDYAHSDDSLRNVLIAARGALAGSGRLWVVFGCGGDRDRTKRPRMGHVASDLADVAVVTSDNPRRERPEAIIEEVLAGVRDERRGAVIVEADRARAIDLAVREAEPGDLVVIAGKGHETEQILPDGAGGVRTVHFDDREVAGEALARRRAVARAGAA
ncbi:MAG: UDP-N-acetylmuramoyl-L-alanyl-D-glutamate--2,6-diaminopimelate ligase [Phycisphaerae bacterium]|nr:MAG: UDP-N-acetylmuramoyl-L-alanyl-D-glutamate--2,6-diaminopimelate ligase [Phycisphaerae bacterium]